MPDADAEKPHGMAGAGSGVSDEHVINAFALLANETRLNILLAIWEAHELHDDDNTVAFSQIFDRVDHDDPGNVRYHLEKLKGPFIRQHTERGGYELRIPAQKLVRAVIAGTGTLDQKLEPTEVDQACPLCDAPTTVSYREGILFWSCTECGGVSPGDSPPGEPTAVGPLSALPFDPAGIVDRTPEELRAATIVLGQRELRSMFDGICPACSGAVDGWFECCPDHNSTGACEDCGLTFPHSAWFQCRTCEHYLTSMPHRLALLHPAVVSLYDDHGVSTRVRVDDFEHARRIYDLMLEHDVEIVAEEPARVAVTASMDGDTVRLIFDETMSVINVHR